MDFKQRLHAFDAFRVLLALLGIVFHSLLAYSTTLHGFLALWPIHDPAASQSNLYWVLFLHGFRMPAFFLLAGFFAARTYQKHSYGHLLRHRLISIGLVFVFFWLLVAFSQTGIIFFVSIQKAWPLFFRELVRLGSLWFLYYLLLIYVAIFILLPVVSKKLALGLKKQGKWVLAFLVFASLLLMYCTGKDLIPIYFRLNPDVLLLGFYACFFLGGWWLHVHYQKMVSYFKQVWLWLVVALVCAAGYEWIVMSSNWQSLRLLAMLLMILFAWLMSFTLLALCHRYLNISHRWINSLSQRTYWIYLAQVPIVYGLQAWFGAHHWAVGVKFLVVMGVCLALILLTYPLVIRKTWLKRWMAGKL